MFNASYKIENPGEMLATLKITMKVKEWEELRDQLKSDFPSWKLGEIIGKMLRQVETVIYPPTETEGN